MGTDRPPPYFPQGSLSPPDPKRYLKFKLFVAGIILLILLGLGGLVWGGWYLVSRVL
ncbi:MAG TPA: hypothetical protein VGN86_12775 [Pyrinomonadaceae bacterium]|nr:hypothetical protein [Pyrinomonadaceae bacterium]